MGRSLWLADVLADAYRGVPGVRLEVLPGWKTAGRDNAAHRGLINHHTGRGSYDALLRYMSEGSSIAPLCNVASSGDGRRVTVVASGKANHAGRGSLPWTGTDMGNVYGVGWEAQNDGAEPWQRRHLEVVAIGNAAILEHLGAGVDRMADHKDYAPRRKVDRHSVSLPDWRRTVAALMEGRPAPTPSPTSSPTSSEEDDVELVKQIQTALNKAGARDQNGNKLRVDGAWGAKTEAAFVNGLKLGADAAPRAHNHDARYARKGHGHKGSVVVK